MTTITRSELMRLLDYDPITGVFTRRIGTGRGAAKGAVAGTRNHAGYVVISLKRRRYMAQKLAWLWVNGVWPTTILDHEDLDKSNNAIDNLREATKSLNAANSMRHKDNTSGFKGVSLHKASGRWRATIGFNRKQIGLGYYLTPERAHQAYCAKAKELFGEFWRP